MCFNGALFDQDTSQDNITNLAETEIGFEGTSIVRSSHRKMNINFKKLQVHAPFVFVCETMRGYYNRVLVLKFVGVANG